MFLLLFLFFTCATALVPSSGQIATVVCDSNYVLYIDQCYRFYPQPLANYGEALSICKSDIADLVSIHNAFVNTLTQNKDKNGVLIGLRYNETTLNWTWSDGTPVDFTSYAPGFVENHDYFGDCAKIYKSLWYNIDCDEDRLPFLCYKKALDVVLTPNDVCADPSETYMSSGVLVSSGYPDEFDFDEATQAAGCIYKLAGKTGFVTKLKIEEMYIREKQGSIIVYNTWDMSEGSEVIRLNDDFKGAEITISHHRVLLHLVGAARGKWKIIWDTVEASQASAAPSDICPEKRIINVEPGEILSPGYPAVFNLTQDDYNLGCSYKIIANREYFVALDFEDIRLQDKEGKVEVYEGLQNLPENRVSRLNNDNESQQLLVTSDKVLIQVSNASHGRYKIKWSRQDPAQVPGRTPSNICPDSSIVYSTPGILLSPGYPEEFNFDQQTAETGCFYQLFGESNYAISIKFQKLHMESGQGSIRIYKTWDAVVENQVVRADNDFEGGTLTVNYTRVLLHLTGAMLGRFKVEWQISKGYQPSTCPEPSTVFTEPNTILSPGYPASYELPADLVNVGCSYRLISKDRSYIRLHFDEIKFENDMGHIEVYEGWETLPQNRVIRYDNNDQGQEYLVLNDRVVINVNIASRGTYKIRWWTQTCRDGWIYHEDACYFNPGSGVTQSASQTMCAQQDSNLTSITSEAEQYFITSKWSSCYYWIGLVKSDSWHWIDGSPFSYQNWESGYPNGPTSGALCNGRWRSMAETSGYSQICKQTINSRKRI